MRIVFSVNGHSITLSNPQKLFWKDQGITKKDIAQYYQQISTIFLPYLRNRPVTTVVFPEGVDGPFFYRRELPEFAPEWMQWQWYKPETKEEPIRVPILNDLASILWFVNLGTIEFHPWNSHYPAIEEPDFAVFDLDPGPDCDFPQVCEATLAVLHFLESRGLRGVAKTSGKSGIHIYVPIAGGYSYPFVREWVKRTAEILEQEHPSLLAVASGRSHIGSRVSIDYAQNAIGKNMAAPYTLRAWRIPTVSTPISLQELKTGSISPEQFTIFTVPERIKQKGDLFADALHLKQHLPEL